LFHRPCRLLELESHRIADLENAAPYSTYYRQLLDSTRHIPRFTNGAIIAMA
jgi:hypothetical protein